MDELATYIQNGFPLYLLFVGDIVVDETMKEEVPK